MSETKQRRNGATITEVAKRAGVAPSTVSNVLSNRHDCWASEETRDRIRRAVEELGYRPNPMAKALRRGKSLSIGWVVPDICNPYFASLARALEDRLHQRGYTLLIEDAHSDPKRAGEALSRLLYLGVDGIIPSYQSKEQLRDLADRGLPVLGFAIPGAEAVVDVVEVDLYHGMQLLVEHLIGLGHTRFGFLHGKSPTQKEDVRLGMLRQILHGHQLVVPDSMVWSSGHTPEEARVTAAQIFQLPTRERPSVVICPNDFMALGVMRAARDAGLAIPADVSITGFDDSWLADLLPVSLTSPRQPVNRMADAMVELLFSRMENPQQPMQRIGFKPHLVVRESSGQSRLATEVN